MRFSTLCPVSDAGMNKWVTRFNAIFTFLLLLLFFKTQSLFVIIFLALDFALRANELSKYSPLAFLSKYVVKVLGIKTFVINAGPKLFAARIGYTFCILILLLGLFRLPVAANVVAGILALFAFLEGAFGFCMACYLYPFVYKFAYRESYRE